jgi:MFS transporter, OPA family, solute carrier family 37 (glycerol-3-phosphate transporter), member 1/2
VLCGCLTSWSGWAPFNQANGNTLLGTMDTVFLFAYAGGMFVSGHLAERFNLRHFLFVGMVGTVLFTAMYGLAEPWSIHSLVYFVFVEFFAGLFQSTGWPSVVTAMGNWFGKSKRGLIMGIWNGHTNVGNILGKVIPNAVLDINWSLALIVPAIIMGFVALLIQLFLVVHPEDVGLADQHEDQSDGEMLLKDDSSTQTGDARKSHHEKPALNFFQALKIPGVIEFSMCLFFCKLVAYSFMFWLPTYLQRVPIGGVYQDKSETNNLSTLFDVGGFVGGFLAGFISDYSGMSATTSCVFLVLNLPMLYVYHEYGNVNLAANTGLMFLTGAIVNGPYSLITTAVSADLGTHPSLKVCFALHHDGLWLTLVVREMQKLLAL